MENHENRSTRRLVDAVQALSQARDLDRVRAIVRSAARQMADADGATFVLRDGDLCHYVDEDAIGPLDAYRPTFVKSLVMVPIRETDPIGAIGVYWADRREASGATVELLQALANTTAVALENVRVYQACPWERGLYYVQLAWVAPRLAAGRTEGLEPFLFTPFDSFLYAVDLLGYSFMSLATLFAARVFTGVGLERVVRRFLTANGLLLPFIALQMYVDWLIWIAALWAVTFPGSTCSLAVMFRRAPTTRVARQAPPLPIEVAEGSSVADVRRRPARLS